MLRRPLGGRLYRLLTPLMSLRVMVIAAALSVVAVVRTARMDGVTVSVPRAIVLPQFENGYA